MRKLIILWLFLISRLITEAQAPVLDAGWLPNAGDKYYKYDLYGDTIINPADTGANIIWDYKSVFGKASTPFDSFDFVNPASRSINCLNNAANLASGSPDNCFCFIKNANGVYLTEHKEIFPDTAIGRLHAVFTKPELWLKNNINFRQTLSDTSIYYYNWNNATDSPFRGKEIKYIKYDGYGTLKIAGYQYDSVIRIREQFINNDTAADVAKDSTIWSYDQYNWYNIHIHAPLVSIIRAWHIRNKHFEHDTLKTELHASITMPVDSLGSSPHGSGIGGAGASFNGNSIIINGAQGQNFTYALFDAAGRLITDGKPEIISNKSWQIPVSNISQGMYILRIQDKTGQSKSIKLVKDR
jgi:hypothetical protein